MNRLGKALILGCFCAYIGNVESAAAMNLETESPLSGMSVVLNNYYASRLNPQQDLAEDLSVERLAAVASPLEVAAVATQTAVQPPKSQYEDIAISQVSGYVNIRQDANTTSAVVGKLYNNCAATIVKSIDGEGGVWYQIQSGNVNGYIKAQYFITGKDAEAKAKEVGNTYATVTNTDSLRLREQPNLESSTLTVLANGAHYLVLEEKDNFLKLAIDIDLEGYVFKDYVTTNVEFEQAVSVAEEQAKAAEDAKRKKEADDALKALEAVKKEESAKQTTTAAKETAKAETKAKEKETVPSTVPASPKGGDSAVVQTPPTNASSDIVAQAPTAVAEVADAGPTSKPPAESGSSSSVNSATRSAIIAYSKQFLGNPYVYGGTSLTNGADCSGFTQSIFANFGISIGRSSRDQAAKGKEIAVDAVQPGDLLFYASGNYINHVAIYIGGGQVIHSSNPTTGITTAPAHYRTPCKAVTFLN